MSDPQDDCYHRALPDEPRFTLLARDPDFSRLVREWVYQRERMIACGERPIEDLDRIAEAMTLATDGARWRRENLYRWRGEGSEAGPV